MDDKPRISGDWPPPELWAKYPNWEPALEEEGVPGQDENTLRPADEQTYICELLACTAGDAHLGDGRRAPALVEILGVTPSAVVLFLPEGLVRIHEEVELERWAPFLERWFPPDRKNYLEVAPEDSRIFPLKFVTRLPRKPGDRPWEYLIDRDGSVKRS